MGPNVNLVQGLSTGPGGDIFLVNLFHHLTLRIISLNFLISLSFLGDGVCLKIKGANVKRMEIELDLALSGQEAARLELHSFNNVMNVIYGELQFMAAVVDDIARFSESLGVCHDLLESFRNKKKTERLVSDLEKCKENIHHDIEEVMSYPGLDPKNLELLEESRKNIKRVLEVVDVRVQELLSRNSSGGPWERMPVDQVERDLRQVFKTIELNARGRYGIVFEEANQGANDYLIHIRVEGLEKGWISIPPVLTDCFRDLTANARKYTAPGGRIEGSLIEDESGVTLKVADNGRGIPEDEIAQVVRFGIRGSNTKPNETKGGGYGLTKAYYVCKQHRGRMWIESELGVGTTITLSIPKPEK